MPLPVAEPSETVAVVVEDPVDLWGAGPSALDSPVVAKLSRGLLSACSAKDQTQWVGSAWEEFLVEVVDPVFQRRSDGWHFYNPDTLDGVRLIARRSNGVALAGGLKFTLSF